jgi:hypothetical protein
MIIFPIKHRWTGAVVFTAEIDATDDRAISIKLGLAVQVAVKAGADLSGANLSRADLSRANLSGADLSGADLSEANLSGAPIIEDIHSKVYAAASQPGALDMGAWHEKPDHPDQWLCGTSHCRAGWVVALAGKEGLDLEAKIGTPAAALSIYIASDPDRWKTERLPDFHCDNATALADMARMAGVSP